MSSQNANQFDWGPFDLADHEMADGKLVHWAEQFLAAPPKQPFFLATGIYRPHLSFYAPRKYFDMYPLDPIIPPEIKEDDGDDLPLNGTTSLPSPSLRL